MRQGGKPCQRLKTIQAEDDKPINTKPVAIRLIKRGALVHEGPALRVRVEQGFERHYARLPSPKVEETGLWQTSKQK